MGRLDKRVREVFSVQCKMGKRRGRAGTTSSVIREERPRQFKGGAIINKTGRSDFNQRPV